MTAEPQRWAVFITSIALDPDEEPDMGISIAGLTDEEEIAEKAQDAFAELIGNEGPSDPWIITDEQLAAIEALLPAVKHEGVY